jgi:hypothetical protein
LLYWSQTIVILKSNHCYTEVKPLLFWSQTIVILKSNHCYTEVQPLSFWSQTIVILKSNHCYTEVKGFECNLIIFKLYMYKQISTWKWKWNANEQFFSENKLYTMKWWWCPQCTRPTCLVGFYSVSSLKQQSAGRHVAQLRHIILIPSQPVFAFFSLMLHA